MKGVAAPPEPGPQGPHAETAPPPAGHSTPNSSASLGEGVEQSVRRGAEDRWLASRLAPQPERGWLTALAALDLEFARIPQVTSQAPAAALRLRWWLDQIEALLAGRTPEAHPVLQTLAAPLATGRLPLEPFGVMAEARLRELEPHPFDTWQDLEAYLDGAAAAPIRLGALACWPGGPLGRGVEQALAAAGRAYGLTQLLRQLPAWTARRRLAFPRRLMERVGLSAEEAFSPRPGHPFASAKAALRERALSWHKEAQAGLAGLPGPLFPAVAHAALTPMYHRAMQREGDSRPEGRVPLLSRQVRIVAAAAAGRI